MKIHYILLTVGLITTPLIAFVSAEETSEETLTQPQEQPAALDSQQDKLSYSFGQNIGNSLKQQKIELNLDLLMKGIQDAVADKKSLLTAEEMQAVLKEFQKERFAKLAEERKALAETNLKEGEAFLTANKDKEGVITLPSGLQYKVITQGTGKTPKATDQVTTHYRGTLIDGTEFDSSYKRGKPATFAVNQVIPGWTEALQLMKEGDKWQLFIPAKLGYGERGVPGGKIGPNATLIFDIELISVNSVAEEKSPADSKDEVDSQPATDENSQSDSDQPNETKSEPATKNEKSSTSSEEDNTNTTDSNSSQPAPTEEKATTESPSESTATQPSE